MALKISVEDRVSTYPGRVKLTPVQGATDLFDMVRADEPITEGTPINKALFDNKAYTLTKDVTLYVASTGDDGSGDGSVDAPFRTIQKAIDALPKHLGGHIAEISIAFGVYNERVSVENFSNGRLIIGKSGEVFTLRGIDIVNSSFVETNIYQINKADGSSLPLFAAKKGSNVLINNNMLLDGISANVVGVSAENNSHVVVANNTTLTVDNCTATVSATWCSFVSLSTITGSGNVVGMSASQGSIVSYKTDTTEKMWSNLADSGGLVLTGQNSSDLSDATLDL